MAPRKPFLLRLDPAVHDALASWAADEFRSVNGHIEFLLRDALKRAGRAPRVVKHDPLADALDEAVAAEGDGGEPQADGA
ncbi:MAG: hypothetical protein HY275_09585 [Gemmatimonadetes bacterium]|nr:hypothetical protein [Gemmatimonadota bacterium]